MADTFSEFEISLNSPVYEHAIAVTPHDSTDFAVATRALYIGGVGNVSVETVGGESAVIFVAVPAGTTIPIRVTRVNNTGTGATSIVGFY